MLLKQLALMKKSIRIIALIGVVAVLMMSCTKNQVADTTVKSSFEIIQDKILNVSCALSGCHASTADASFTQHGLVLTPGKSYANLVGVMAKNTIKLLIRSREKTM
jgi:hypothetical protein